MILISPEDAAFAEQAIAKGYVTRDQIDACRRRQQALREAGEDLRLGQILVREGHLSPNQFMAVHLSPGIVGENRAEPEVALASFPRSLGKYVLRREIARGGMGIVYEAEDSELRRRVALKTLRDDEADADLIERLRREATIAAQYTHPNIDAIHEDGTNPNDAGRPTTFIAMDYVEGRTLADLIREGTTKRKELIQKLESVARAVAYAHSKGVIHRDLKPPNVMLDRQGQVYVMDFGLAKETSVEGETLTRTRVVVGTPNYMAPEQARGKAEIRSDLYGLGAILYELFTGRPPFVGDSSTEVLMQVVTADLVWPRRLAPGVPADVEAVIIKALEKDLRRRYASAEEMIEDIEALRAREPLRHARRPTFSYVLAAKIRKQPLLWGVGAALVLALLGGAAFGAVTLLQRNRALQAQLRAERKTEAVRRIEDAGRAYQAGQTEAALGLAREAQRLRPDLPGGWYWEARCAIRRYAEQRRLPTPWVSDGIVEFLPAPPESEAARGLREEAGRLVAHARSLAGEGLEGWEIPAAIGTVEVLQGRYVEGGRAIEECLLDANAQWDSEPAYHLALARYFLRRFDEAAALHRHLLRSGAGTELLVRALHGAALRDELAGRSARAADRYEQAGAVAAMHPDETRARILRASVLVTRGDLRLRTGRSADASSDFETARRLADEAGPTSRDGVHARAEASLGLARFHEGRGARASAIPLVRDAIADYGRALALDPAFDAGRIRRGMARTFLRGMLPHAERERESREAVEDLETAARSSPGPTVSLALYRARASAGYERALAELDEILRRHPDHLPVYLEQSKALWMCAQREWETEQKDPAGLFEQARSRCDEAIRRNPEYAEAYRYRAHVFADWGDYVMIHGGDPTKFYEETFADCARALRINTESFDACSERAGKRLSLGVYRANHGGDPEPDWLEAIGDLTRALTLNPEASSSRGTRAMVRMNLALRYEAGGRDPFPLLDEALEDCAEARRRGPDPRTHVQEYGFIHLWKGVLHRKRGQEEDARRHFESAVSELSLSLPKDEDLPAASVTFGERFVARGRARCALGRHEEARKDFERAARLGVGSEGALEECRGH
ncbi:MAG: protein kinase [Planctomycetes bacterium]|nr:protein kinase [Planctomycetota bacterium]